MAVSPCRGCLRRAFPRPLRRQSVASTSVVGFGVVAFGSRGRKAVWFSRSCLKGTARGPLVLPRAGWNGGSTVSLSRSCLRSRSRCPLALPHPAGAQLRSACHGLLLRWARRKRHAPPGSGCHGAKHVRSSAQRGGSLCLSMRPSNYAFKRTAGTGHGVS